MEVFLIRHGDPDYEHDTITEAGHREARKLAASLSTESVTALYVSPLGRARDTMSYTAETTRLSFTVLDWLREVDAPAVDGLCAWELPGTYVLGQPQLPCLDTWPTEPLFGHSFLPYYKDIAAGFDAVMQSYGCEKHGHLYRIRESSTERLAFFCHKGTILTLLSYLLHWPLPVLFPHCTISTTGVTRLLWNDPKNEGWATPQLQVLNDLSHLLRPDRGA